VDLRRIDLRGAGLCGKKLANLDLTEAHLKGADLSGTTLANVTLDKADLRGTTWQPVWDSADLWRCSLRSSRWEKVVFGQIKFRDCDATGASWSRSVDQAWFARCQTEPVGRGRGRPVGFELPASLVERYRRGHPDEVARLIRAGAIGGQDLVTLGDWVWRVLQVGDRSALVLSEFLVDVRPYHERLTAITWADCSLRAWLNGEFFEGLSPDLRERVSVAHLADHDNPSWETLGGPPTEDRVFLLSYREAETEAWFPSVESRTCARHDGRKTWWWLRSPGGDGGYAAGVYDDGYVRGIGDFVFYAAGGVRPALFFNLES
jgi:hypothetical protein